ncbi:hypothetical protein [Streptomyces tubercidicus]
MESIALGLSAHVSQARARELAWALAVAPFRADEVMADLLRRVRARMPLVLVTNATLELENDLASLGFGRNATPSHQTLSSSRTGPAPESRTVPGRSAPQ